MKTYFFLVVFSPSLKLLDGLPIYLFFDDVGVRISQIRILNSELFCMSFFFLLLSYQLHFERVLIAILDSESHSLNKSE